MNSATTEAVPALSFHANDRLKRSSIARVPLACRFLVPVPVKCGCVITGAAKPATRSHASP